jgi:hypothetical protein
MSSTASGGDPFGVLPHRSHKGDSGLVDEVGGEWEREGLGKGLEERLDALYGPVPTATTA